MHGPAPAPGRASGDNQGMNEPLLDVRHLRKSYGATTVVDDVSFAIAPGEGLGVIALNGKMIEAPIVHHARRVIASALASGVRQ